MKLNTLFVAIVLLITGAASAVAQTPKQNQVLFDFRLEKRGNVTRIPPAAERAILSKIFRKFLPDTAKCNPQFDPGNAADYLKVARDAGQFAPSILDQATGSFTAAGQTQTAYLISSNECGASHADNFGSKRMAIFSGDKLVTNVDVEFRSTILRKTDFNGDGIDELLLMTSDMNQGIIVETAALVEFKNGRANVIEDFGQATEDSCGSSMPGSESIAAVISYPAGAGMPKFRTDHYRSACRKVKVWRFKSTGKL